MKYLKSYKLFETPDHVNHSGYELEINKDAIPFAFEFVCGTLADGTPLNTLEKANIGKEGKYHSASANLADGVIYPGRIWMSAKMITLWIYPDPNTFKRMIVLLNDKLRSKDLHIDDDWNIEVYLDENNKLICSNLSDFDESKEQQYYYRDVDYDAHYEIIKVGEYTDYL